MKRELEEAEALDLLRRAAGDLSAGADLEAELTPTSFGPAPAMPQEARLALRRAEVARGLIETARAHGQALSREEALTDAARLVPAADGELEARTAAWSRRLRPDPSE